VAVEDGVVQAVAGLEEVPPVDEREIIKVDFEHVDWRYRPNHVHEKECQRCGEHVDLLEPHVYACIWTGSGTYRILNKPVYCDRECWIAWLGGEE